MSKLRRKANSCSNCNHQLVQKENYCPECGQENHDKQASTRLLFKDFVDTYLSFDSKLIVTVGPLLFSPGKITKEYLDGKRIRFVPPIRLFIFLSFIYFGISNLLDDSTSFEVSIDGTSEENQAALAELFQRNTNLMVLLFLPIHSLILMLFFRSEKRRYFVNFFVFTLHLFSFFFILSSLFQLLLAPFESYFGENQFFLTSVLIIEIGIAVYIFYYSLKSLKITFEKRYNILRFVSTFLISLFFFIVTFIAFLFVLSQFSEIT